MTTPTLAEIVDLHEFWLRHGYRKLNQEDISRHRKNAAAALYAAGNARHRLLVEADVLAHFEEGAGPNDPPHVHRDTLASKEERETLSRDAMTLYEAALQFDPGFAESLYNQGALHRRKGNIAEARDLFQRASVCEPHPRAKPHAFLVANATWENAVAEEKIGSSERAEHLYRKATELLGNFGTEHRRFANLLHRNGKIEEAMHHYQQALPYSHRYAPELVPPDFEAAELPPKTEDSVPLNPLAPTLLPDPVAGYPTMYFLHLYFRLSQEQEYEEIIELVRQTPPKGVLHRLGALISRKNPYSGLHCRTSRAELSDV